MSLPYLVAAAALAAAFSLPAAAQDADRGGALAAERCATCHGDDGRSRTPDIPSLAGQQGGLVAGAHYASSKAGIIVLTKIFAKDLAADGVTVNAVAPAAIRTPAMDAMDPAKLEASRQGIPVGRFGEAYEVAETVAYLARDEAAFVGMRCLAEGEQLAFADARGAGEGGVVGEQFEVDGQVEELHGALP